MQTLRKSMAAAVFALSAVCNAGLAQAATTAISFNGGSSAAIGNSTAAGANFNDYFTFTLPSYATGSGAVDVFSGLDATGAPNVSIGNVLLDQVVSPGVYSLVATSNSVVSGINLVSFSGLAQNTTYALNVSGTTLSSLGGSYSGNVTLNVAPVPEPGEWLLMLAGLGFVGFMASRSGRAGCGHAV